jgi:hypothetical protein
LFALILFAIIAFAFTGCSSYYTIGRTNVRLQYGSFRGNHCAGDRGPEVAEVVELVRQSAEKHGLLKSWPPSKISVCIVDQAAIAVCGSVALGGCAFRDRVIVPLRLVRKLGEHRLRTDYVWQNQLAHEFVGALTLQGLLYLPRAEPELVASDGYKAILRHVREARQ